MGARSVSEKPTVVVLGGGPDAEREVSLASAAAVASALESAGHGVESLTIDRVSAEDVRAMPGEVIFPVLHGSWGEGGPLQGVLEASGRAFVGSGSRAARLSMDKLATKLEAARLGIATAGSAVLNPADPVCPLPVPVVVKPVHEGSSVGLMICRSDEDWGRAHERVCSGEFGGRVFMVEQMVAGRELTVGLLAGDDGGLVSLPIVEIVPASGVYDYEAKYERGDTRYVVEPELPEGAAELLSSASLGLAGRLGVRHLCRVDFILDARGACQLLELNTMPGFTASSLLPKAAGRAGVDLPGLVSRLVRRAKDEGSAAVAGG